MPFQALNSSTVAKFRPTSKPCFRHTLKVLARDWVFMRKKLCLPWGPGLARAWPHTPVAFASGADHLRPRQKSKQDQGWTED